MSDQQRIRFLEEQVEQLKREKRAFLEAIDVAANVGNFQVSLNRIDDPIVILKETALRIRTLLDLKQLAFYLVNEDDSDFTLGYVEPEDAAAEIEAETEALIEDKTFSWALGRNKPVIVSSIDKKSRVILHSMATTSRVRGIFVGVMSLSRGEITDLSLFLFSITIIACSNGLESFELYRRIRERNVKLNENVARLEESRNLLSEREALYRALFEQAASGIVLIDPDGCEPVEFNDKALLGYAPEEFRKLRPEEYEPDKSAEQINQRYQEMIAGELNTYETRYLCKNGTFCDIIVNGRPVQALGKTFLLLLLTDVTLRKQNEEERLNLEKQLRQVHKMESIGTLAGGIAHDFNNILAIIMGFAELTLLDLPESESVLRLNMTSLIKAVERAKKLVMQILTFSRGMDDVNTPFRLDAVVKEALALIRATLPANVNITYTQEGHDLFLMGDPTQAHQVILNLCSNASYAVRGKSGAIDVDLRTAYLAEEDAARLCTATRVVMPGTYVQLTVSDNGIGMTDEVMERVFDPYFTTKAPAEGTGLGMSVIHGIVERYKGHILIDSVLNEGTCIVVRLPMLILNDGPTTLPFSDDYMPEGFQAFRDV